MAGTYQFNPNANADNSFSYSWMRSDASDQRELARQLGLPMQLGNDPALLEAQLKDLDNYAAVQRARFGEMAKADPQGFNVQNAQDATDAVAGIRNALQERLNQYNQEQAARAQAIAQVTGQAPQSSATSAPASKERSLTTVAQASTMPSTKTGQSTASTTETTTGAPSYSGESTMTPLQFPQFAPEQPIPEMQYDPRLAYRNGQTTRQYTFDNGQPVNFTNNPFFNNGGDPNYSSWSGLNMGMNTPLSLAQRMVLTKMLNDDASSLSGFRASQSRGAIQEAMNDPRAWQATRQLLEQGVPMEEAQYAAIGQLLDNQGQYGALNMVVPQYAQAAAQRQGNQGALAGLFGMNYEAQPNLFGVTSPISSIQTDGGMTAIQLGNARYNIPNEQVPQFMQQIAAIPGGPQILQKMATGRGLSLQEQLALEEAKNNGRLALEREKQSNRESSIDRTAERRKDVISHTNEVKNSNTVSGSTRF